MKAKSLSTAPSVATTPAVPPIQVADLVLEEVIDRNEHPLVFTGSARQYRADCQLGQFSAT